MNFFHNAQNAWHTGVEKAGNSYWVDLYVELPDELLVRISLHCADSSAAVDVAGGLTAGGIYKGEYLGADISLSRYNIRLASVAVGATENSKHVNVVDQDNNGDTYCLYL